MAAASLVLGLVSLVLGIWVPYIGLPVGIVGIILAAVAKKKGMKGPATAGLVLSIIGTVLCGILYLACVACAAAGAAASSSLF